MSVTDMLIAILNCCTKEELEEEEETPMITPESPELEQEGEISFSAVRIELMIDDEDNPERRQVIKNKILAVGRMSRVFALLRLVFVLFFPLCLPPNLEEMRRGEKRMQEGRNKS
jgi:serine/threonine-protein phosphatase 2B catalytic subunit